MSRAVCGVCFCPYGDEGDCACSTETHYKKVIDGVQALFDAKREQPTPVAKPHEREWVGLTDEEIAKSLEQYSDVIDPSHEFWKGITRAIEAKLKAKNSL